MTPMVSVETLWKDYIAFEQGINPIIAEKMSMERSRDYMNARRVAKEYEAITRGLNRNFPSVPPVGTPEELRQVCIFHNCRRLIMTAGFDFDVVLIGCSVEEVYFMGKGESNAN